jgi:hypothetical protein
MSNARFLCAFNVLSVILVICLCNVVWAVDTMQKPTVTDIALNNGGKLEGQVVNRQNIGQPGVTVTIRSQDRVLSTTTTDANGQFAYQNVPSGVYHLVAAQNDNVVRLWAPQTAPPSASNIAVVYLQDVNPSATNGQQVQPVEYVENGQSEGGNGGPVPNNGSMGGGNVWKGVLGCPLIIPAAIATAIAVPIALSSHHQPASP